MSSEIALFAANNIAFGLQMVEYYVLFTGSIEAKILVGEKTSFPCDALTRMVINANKQ